MVQSFASRVLLETQANGHSLRGGDGCIFSRDANGETLQV